METRRTALVDLSLDLIQKLIARGHLAGSIYNISHRRDSTSGRSARKVGCAVVICSGWHKWPVFCHACNGSQNPVCHVTA